MLYVRTSSLADIQALDLLLRHSQNVDWITTTQTNPRHEKRAHKLLHQPVPFMK